jgi:hypothetical protein
VCVCVCVWNRQRQNREYSNIQATMNNKASTTADTHSTWTSLGIKCSRSIFMQCYRLGQDHTMKQYATRMIRAEVELMTKTSMERVYAIECQKASFRLESQLSAPGKELLAL